MPAMKANGNTISPMELESLDIAMEMFTKATGSITKQMEKVLLSVSLDLAMMDLGKKMCSMDSVKSFGLKVHPS